MTFLPEIRLNITMRRPFIAANWKMNKTVSEAREFVQSLLPSVKDVGDTEIVIAPPFTSLFAVAELLKGTNIGLAAQDVYYEEKGAFTGEVSPVMLKDAGCGYVIAGHSERRQYFSESDEVVNRKVRASQKNGIRVILCIGESLSEREAGKTFDVLDMQMKGSLKEVDAQGLVIAYEPVWAIGTGRTATTDQAQEAHAFGAIDMTLMVLSVAVAVIGWLTARRIYLKRPATAAPGCTPSATWPSSLPASLCCWPAATTFTTPSWGSRWLPACCQGPSWSA